MCKSNSNTCGFKSPIIWMVFANVAASATTSIPRSSSNILRIADLMTAGAKTIAPKALAAEAVQLMEKHKINQMLVVDEGGALVGALNMHDLFRAKVI